MNKSEIGSKIRMDNGNLLVPDFPIIPFIEGDGIGPDVWRAAVRVLDAGIAKAFRGKKKIIWKAVLAGKKAFDIKGTWLPQETIDSFNEYLVGIKGPLTTPVGGGIRSLNVALRKSLDLFVCQRPVHYYDGVPSPVKHPENVDMVIFRENTEDIYAGIEFESGSDRSKKFLQLLKENFPEEFAKIRFPETSGIGIKPVSEEGTKRLVKAAIEWALKNNRRSVTLVHKGNIMKFTEGAFRSWGYEIAEAEFENQVYTMRQWSETKKLFGEAAADLEKEKALGEGRLLIKDIIADIALEQTITQPESFDVLATLNLNGDYLSDALAAQVGGVGIAPGANINYESGCAIFEATHGTAPIFADKDVANPCSLLLSGVMMLQYLGWNEAAEQIVSGLEKTISQKTVTFDFHRLMENAVVLHTSEFADAIIRNMQD